MTDLTDDQYRFILHAFGLTPRGRGGRCGRRWAYRNYFCAGGPDVKTGRSLAERGLAKEHAPTKLVEYPTFLITERGAEAAGVRGYIPSSVRLAEMKERSK